MCFNNLSKNKIVEIQTNDPNETISRIIGIVLDINQNQVVLLTEIGKILKLDSTHFISVLRCELDNYVEQRLEELKDFYIEKQELLFKLNQMEIEEKDKINDLLDANLLAHYSVWGAKNRLMQSLDNSLFNFYKNMCNYEISFEPNLNEDLDLIIKVIYSVTYSGSEIVNGENLILDYAPDEMNCIKNCFKLSEVLLENRDFYNVQANNYKVYSIYRVNFKMDYYNFIEQREYIRNGLYQLKK